MSRPPASTLSAIICRAEGQKGAHPRRPDTLIAECGVLDIPYEILRMPQALAGRDVCVVVIFSAHGQISGHVSRSLRAYKAAEYAVIAVVQTDGLECKLEVALCDCEGILLRANHGWDFAAWATALAVFPDLWSASSLILTNDSIYGPVATENLGNILQRVRRSVKDVVALTDSYQVRRHMMSYFTAITQSGLAHPAIRGFWGATVRSLRDKDRVIALYELTSIDRLSAKGATFEVLFETARTDSVARNPTLSSWRDLLARGFPFVKVQALRDTLAECDRSGWQAQLAANPGLTCDIEAHLAGVIAAAPTGRRRPVPAPHRRFDVDFGLATSYGATPACRPSEATDLALQVPFGLAQPQSCPAGPVAVIVHIFYLEFCDDLLAALNNIPVSADLYVSTDTERKKRLIQARLAGYANGSLSVRVFANVGRDIAPMLVGHADVFARYEVFLHLHSKKSLHDSRFAGWRRFLLDNLLGSREVVQSILSMFGCTDMGVVFSQHYPTVSGLINFGYDYALIQDLLRRCGIPIAKNMVLDFPSGSFFWARTKLFKPLLDCKLTWSDFPAETGQVDGTIAHAIERSILYLAEAAGLRWAKVAQPGGVRVETLIPVEAVQTIEDAIARVYRPMLTNPLQPIEARTFMGEVRPISSRPDPTRHPRLNLLLPTLQPEKIFGGVSTALAVFTKLQEALGETFDYRIVVTTDRVTMDAMLLLPGYRLLQIGSLPDRYPRLVVDASQGLDGELSVRINDFFIATAWWTATNGTALGAAQKRYHKKNHKLIYLIQDHEADFYGWSSQHGMASETYAKPDDIIALVNSEELLDFMDRHYCLKDRYVIPFNLNQTILDAMRDLPRERIILVYGRPGTPRNAFAALCAGLLEWQQSEPDVAASWRIISLGESFDRQSIPYIAGIEVAGKLPLADYADLLSRASVGVSLMLSPHPSYPPLEMACAGLETVTNGFAAKNLSLRHKNIISCSSVTPPEIAAALSQAVARAVPSIGRSKPVSMITPLPPKSPLFDAAQFSLRLQDMAW